LVAPYTCSTANENPYENIRKTEKSKTAGLDFCWNTTAYG